MKSILSIIQIFGFDQYLKFFIEKNTALKAPYHNFFHTCCVIENCIHIVTHESIYNKNNSENKNTDLRALVCSGLFHDFDHSQGKKSDEENINIAINAFLSTSKETAEFNEKVISLIEATQFPYVIEEKDLTWEQKIIRDADIMQMFEPNYLQQIWIGFLMTELNKPAIESIDMQLNFIKNIKFHTSYAKKIAEDQLPGIIRSFEFLNKLLT